MAIDLAVRRLSHLMETVMWSISGPKETTKGSMVQLWLLVRQDKPTIFLK